jgi:hypothetical protein
MSFATEASKTFGNFGVASIDTLTVAGPTTHAGKVTLLAEPVSLEAAGAITNYEDQALEITNVSENPIFIQASNSLAVMGGELTQPTSALFIADDAEKVAVINGPAVVMLGDVGDVNNGTGIGIDSIQDEIDTYSNFIRFNTEGVAFQGASLQSGSAGAFSGQYMIITLNNVQYKIALTNMS